VKLFTIFTKPRHCAEQPPCNAAVKRGRPRSGKGSRLGARDKKSRQQSKAGRSEQKHREFVSLVDRRNGKSVRTNWTKGQAFADIERAVEHFQKHGSLKRTSLLFGISRSVLRRRIRAGTPICSGPKPALPFDVEKRLENHIIELAEIGFGLGMLLLLCCAGEFLCLDGPEVQAIAQQIAGPKVNGKVFNSTNSWLARFKQRHPEVARRRARALDLLRASGSNEPRINEYFRILGNAYNQAEQKSGSVLLPLTCN